MKRIFIFFVLTLSLSGCGTLLGREMFSDKGPWYYKGVNMDVYMLSGGNKYDGGASTIICYMSMVCPIFTLASVPVDATIDTLMLPFDLINRKRRLSESVGEASEEKL
ncbi:MAG: YceK/YidQ family lipoprotein [Aeromonas veronii]